MELRNISPLGDLWIPSLGVEVPAGGVFTVPDEAAARFLEQPSNFQPVKPAKSGSTSPEKE